MSRAGKIHTVEIAGFGPVTFKAQGKVGMQRVKEAARRSPLQRKTEAAPDEALRMVEDTFLHRQAVIEPQYETEDELLLAFEGRSRAIVDIALEIRRRSWPN